ncbi:tyrosine-type recombinase/integrase [Novosphingobium panipatense]|uniref:Site-specific recombinase XerD n=2 Tax=Novosphingobium panipatense TaxID=428991 RepID=A0ABY1QV51_9SPHN|nr:tyrosine-type recombinase/integrase [Novosphingobium panipatense]SMP81712.1 Site-specific recombinase XerD [Novosphingobium panipatense]SMP82692.1 Site-specific recombinase XerD [Novosphingobium panipatense]SMP83155.1 Site-specific recombinase XerD [Novosphingobium panipatense]
MTLPKTVVSYGRPKPWTGDAPTSEALSTAFHSSLLGSAAGSAALYKAAARHFLFWIEQQGIAVSTVDDAVVRRFEKHRCRCQGFPLHKPDRPGFTSKVRRFVRFLEDQGVIDVPDDVDRLDTLLADYAVFLVQEHYSAAVIKSYRSEAAHFAAWVRFSRLRWQDVTDDHVALYAGHSCRCPVYRKRGTLVGHFGPLRRSKGARRFLGFLRDRNILSQVDRWDHQDDALAPYKTWLKAHCGSSAETIRRYCGEVKHWLPELTKPSELNAGIIRRIVGHRIAQAPGSASTITSIMRSYVRFLVSRGECEPALQHAFPPIRRYRLGTLPRYMDDATIEKIIASCQADTAVEIRDKAIILLLARLGLRAGDICQLRLTDIDWNDGYLRVSGKSRRPDRLPLPQDAGDAILDYIERSRPPIAEEVLFVRVQAPFRPFSSSAEIAGIVARVLDRGAIEGVPTGAHAFRHSLATRMLRAGAGLESVGTILRHRSPATTAIYAKVDVPMLLKVAQDWPGDRA